MSISEVHIPHEFERPPLQLGKLVRTALLYLVLSAVALLVLLPLLTPTLLFLILINTIQSFQAFTQFNVLIGNEGPDNATDVFVFAIFTSFWKDNRYGFASAMSVVLFLILLVLTFIQFRLLDRRVHYQ